MSDIVNTIVTGNPKHFPSAAIKTITVLSPHAALDILSRR